MRRALRHTLTTSLKVIPSGLLKLAFQPDWIGVFYHAVSEKPLPHVDLLYPRIPAAQFEQDLIYLKRNFNPIGYDQLHAHVFESAALPPKAAHLSFDDGYRECFTVVRPLLAKHQIPCTFFISTDWIDNRAMFYRNKASLCYSRVKAMKGKEREELFAKLESQLAAPFQSIKEFSRWIDALKKSDESKIERVSELMGLDFSAYLEENPLYLSRGQIEQMVRDGFTVGSHSRSHYKFSRLDPRSIETEIVESSKIIQNISGADRVPFSFPNSARGIDRELLRDIRRRHPFLGLFFDTKGIKQDEPYLINRIWAEKQRKQPRKPQPNRLSGLIRNAFRTEAVNFLWQWFKK